MYIAPETVDSLIFSAYYDCIKVDVLLLKDDIVECHHNQLFCLFRERTRASHGGLATCGNGWYIDDKHQFIPDESRNIGSRPVLTTGFRHSEPDTS